ncbi:MAG: hypothetical protein NTU88_05335, partial [Armatimonadetes bacterium]|nr:hypothetical protein [Armatimonadota bacterium]
MKSRSLLLLICLAGWALGLVGCGGGGGGGPVSEPGVELVVGADTAYSDRQTPVGSYPQGGAPLDAGARVTVYDFASRQEMANGTLGSDGLCELRVTPGATAAFVITGVRGGKQYRLSTIIAVIAVGGGRCIADPATSIAAEAIAQKHFGKTEIDQGTLSAVLAKAVEYLGAHPAADCSLAGGLICGTAFGAQGSLNANELQAVIAAVPNTINSRVVAAKHCVQQIKEAGVPLASMLTQERPDIEGVFTSDATGRYDGLIRRLHTLMLPAMFGGVAYQNSEGDYTWPTIFDLQIGSGYKAQFHDDEGSGWKDRWFEITDDPSVSVPNQITIIYATEPGVTPSGTYTLTAKRQGIGWTVTQTFTGDPSQLYTISIPCPTEDPGQNPSFALRISLKDMEFTTATTFEGTLSATGPDRWSYTRIVLDGKLTAPPVTAQGRFQADFPSSVPPDANPDENDIYDFPLGFSMTNAAITVGSGSSAIGFTGGISVSAESFVAPGRRMIVPKHIEMTGTYSNAHSGLKFDGSITGDWTNPRETDVSKQNGSIHMRGDLTRKGYPGYSTDV